MSRMCMVRNSLRWILFFFFSSRRLHTRYLRDWSSDVCSSDLDGEVRGVAVGEDPGEVFYGADGEQDVRGKPLRVEADVAHVDAALGQGPAHETPHVLIPDSGEHGALHSQARRADGDVRGAAADVLRSEEHTSELQSRQYL